MDLRVISRFLGKIALAEGGVLFLPLAMAIIMGESSWLPFVGSIILCGLVGMSCLNYGRVRTQKLTMREGIAITGIGWMLATFLGMLPYCLGGYLSYFDGLFESVSGFTGTGATVITDLEILPQSLLLWRSMTHWLGGLGIIVIFIALLPEAGQSAVFYMYNAESTGPTRERVLPRLHDMTKVLFRIYLAFTATAFVIFVICGMDFLDAANHALSTVSAGGFSTYNASAAHFESPAVEGWMTFFMVLTGGNYALYYRAWQKGWGVLWENMEFRVYLLIVAAATIPIGLNLMSSLGEGPTTALRYSSFQAASIATTGFVSADFDRWPTFSKGILLMLMISGGCAGSTAAGLKVSRVVIMAQYIWHAAKTKLHPNQVLGMTINGHRIGDDTVVRVAQFCFLYVMFIALWALLLTFDGITVFDAIGISVSTMGCIGPAFGITGATSTYAELSLFSKSILCLSMLLGRLEMFTLLVMLQKNFWKSKGSW